MSQRTWEQNADAFAALDRGEGWPFAILVACSVEKEDNGGVNRSENGRFPNGKVLARVFAERAGTSAPRILRYLTAWDKAAERGWVQSANTLTPDMANAIPTPTEKWDGEGGVYNGGMSKVKDISTNPGLTAKALTDPKVAQNVVAKLDSTAKEELSKALAESDLAATETGVRKSEAAKARDKRVGQDHARSQKWLEARREQMEGNRPLTSMDLFGPVMEIPGVIKMLTGLAVNGVDTPDTANTAREFITELVGLLGTFRSAVDGELKPLDDTTFDAGVQALLASERGDK